VIDQKTKLEDGANSAVASEASIERKPIPNPAAASDVKTAPPVSINPDELHDLFEGSLTGEGSDDEDPLAQLRNDPNYAALIRDLEYIAAQARVLFAPEEAPSDKVWDEIQKHLGSDAP
jgi:hypothetical protein